MKLIVGLGNPGREYEKTYHNLGFMAIDLLAKKLKTSVDRGKFNALYGVAEYNGEKVILIKPLTYMNLSGDAVIQFVNFYKLSPSDVVVLCDDIDLPKGEVRYRLHGSAGTHNGLKSIVHALNSQEFQRVKIGAGNDKSMDLKDYVLSKIDEESLTILEPCFAEACEKVLSLVGNEK